MSELLSITQVASKLGRQTYTIKRWYNWYEALSNEEKENYIKDGMPELPEYMTLGPTKWRYWKVEDMTQLKKFAKWVPHTKRGVMSNKKEGE